MTEVVERKDDSSLISGDASASVAPDSTSTLPTTTAATAVEEKEEAEEDDGEFTVTAWEVKGVVDYNKLCDQFGCDLMTDEIVRKYERLTGVRAHPMIRRGLYYAHRDFDKIVDLFEHDKPFYLYTGRGPSSESMHLGHMIPFILNKHLMESFGVPLVIQITDDEKFFFKKELETIDEATRLARENAKDIIAMGFDITRTFMFIDSDYMQHMYRNVIKVQEKTSFKTLSKIFGFDSSMIDGDSSGQGNSNVLTAGKVAYPPIQVVPAFASTFPIPFGQDRGQMHCLIPCAIDQDPYFRMCRDVGPRIGELKCTTLYSKFIPGLKGPKGKMSASDPNNAIYLSDDAKTIKRKIMKYAFSGAPKTMEEHKSKGADVQNDVSFQYLTFFMDDDEKLDRLRDDYSSGRIGTSVIKQALVDVLVPIIEEFQRNRALVTDEMLDAFLAVRPLNF